MRLSLIIILMALVMTAGVMRQGGFRSEQVQADPAGINTTKKADNHKWKLSKAEQLFSDPYLVMKATAYDPGIRGCDGCGPYPTGLTATGIKAGRGIAAVDPRIIPLGTRLYIPGYGYALAADIGGAIKGDRIDLCYNTYYHAIDFGVKTVKVYILGYSGKMSLDRKNKFVIQ